ncbi:hypothetical protein [Burkholderia cepacia]|uniref:hypothetical protein n=1 Tax=Burkholderia cepacia TaxID=292 RepID=UPI000AC2616A|nr:hypothetical protein [Burkholderia cepacia]
MDDSLQLRIEMLEAQMRAQNYLLTMLMGYLHGKQALDIEDFINQTETARHTYRALHQKSLLDPAAEVALQAALAIFEMPPSAPDTPKANPEASE